MNDNEYQVIGIPSPEKILFFNEVHHGDFPIESAMRIIREIMGKV